MNRKKKEIFSQKSHIIDWQNIKLSNKKKVNSEFLKSILGKKYKICNKAKLLINKYNLEFYSISPKSQMHINRSIHEKIKKNFFTKSGKQKKLVWNKGWAENLNSYTNNPNDLLPKYYRKTNRIFRIKGKIVFSKNYKFDADLQEIINLIVLKKYVKGLNNIYEFGAGSGNIIFKLIKNLNNKFNYFACDWSTTAMQVLKKIKVRKKKINVFKFDFFRPNMNKTIKENSLVFTNGALEQTGSNYKKFLDYLIKKKPIYVVNFEPLTELYNKKNFNDKVMRLYAKKRNYLSNYILYLKKLECNKKIIILDKKRIAGGTMQEALSFVVWKPI